MKWKTVFALLSIPVVLASLLAAFIVYYHFDWSDLASISFYEDLANPSMRIVRIPEGVRREQVVAIVGGKLGWDETAKDQFLGTQLAVAGNDATDNLEGYYFPKTYMMSIFDTPESVSSLMVNTFEQKTANLTKGKTTRVVNESTAVKIASIIQRESGGTSDMRLISGIIWNRLFKGMKLQMDATLQYAKGNEEDGWWPAVDPSDKNIDSPYNTYKYPSLPPTPIASPGLAALAAAYNPQSTSCLFYLHDKKGQIHCSATYDGHLKNIQKYY